MMLAASLLISPRLLAAPPNLIEGGVPDSSRTINLGPTGMRGWVYHVNGSGRTADTSEARQIQVKIVDAGSPAAGALAANDVILGADGTGAEPVDFTSDARKALAQAIADAEARNPATLRLRRWRSGTTENVTITLQHLGAYSATAPYNCPKSAEILKRGLAAITSNNETAGRYSFGTLGLIAGNNPADPANAARITRAQNEARAKVPSASTRTTMMSDNRDATYLIPWERGHTLIMLSEYYLFTRDSLQQPDAQIIPGIEAYAVNIAKNSSLFGTLGHRYAYPSPDGSPNGPLGGFYGAVNSAGVPCFLGLVLARECLPADSPHLAVIDAAIARSNRFFRYYANKGAIPYGEHAPDTKHEGNGRMGAAAICFSLLNDRVPEARFFAKSATAAGSEREIGHNGAYFNYLWAPLGAAIGGEAAAAYHFSRVRWMLDLNRRWNGLFVYDNLNGEGPSSGATFNDFRMSTAALLTYALPLRQLRITGKSPNPAHLLSSADVAEAAAAETYSTAGRSNADLIADTASFSQKTRLLAATRLGSIKDSVTTTQRNQLHTTATNTALPAFVRAGACDALGRIGHGTSATILVDLLSDPNKHVRFAAAEALRYLPTTERDAQLVKILQAAANNARPLYPLDEEDPLQFDHGRLSMLLFYNGTAYGPKGIIVTQSKFDSVSRSLMYPAIRAVAQTPVGLARSAVATVYGWLNQDDLNAVAGPVVDAVRYSSPADRMFSHSVRQSGLRLLERHNNAEGIPAGLEMLQDLPASQRAFALRSLELYAASYRSVTPEPDVPGVVSNYLNNTDGNAEENAAIEAAAQGVLDAINADTNPRTLIPFKRIISLSADHPQLILPANSTVLRLDALDYAGGDSRFTWNQVSGLGTVSLSTNGNAAAAQTTATFPSAPGAYRFEAKMADSRGLTEVSRTMDVQLFTAEAALPENDTAPPVPGTMDFLVPPAATGTQSVSMTALTAFDLNGVEYFFDCTAGGAPDSEWQDSPVYAPVGLTPSTTYSFRVMARDKSNRQNETAFSATASAITPALPSNGTWIIDGIGNWSDTSKWSGGTVAEGVGFTAFLSNVITADRTITLDTDHTIGNIFAQDTSHNYTISGTKTLTLDVTTGAPEINVVNNRQLTISSKIAGNEGLSKTGPGTLLLRGDNTGLSGTIDLQAGRLSAGGATTSVALGTEFGYGAINVTSGAFIRFFQLSNASTVAYANDLTLRGNGNGTGALQNDGSATVNHIIWDGTITLAADATINAINSGRYTFNGDINQSGGSRTLILTGNGGPQAINAGLTMGTVTHTANGAVNFGSASVIDVSTWSSAAGAGALNFGTATVNSLGTLTTARDTSLGMANQLTASTVLNVQGGAFDLGGFSQQSDAFTQTGGTVSNGTLTASSLALNGGTFAAVPGGSGTISFGGGTLQQSDATDHSARFNTAPGQQFRIDVVGAANNVTWATDLTSTDATLMKSGDGILTLAGTNTYTGTTSISAGTLKLASAGSLAHGTGVSIAAGATFDLTDKTTASASYIWNTASLSASGAATAATITGTAGGTIAMGTTPISLTTNATNPSLTVTGATLELGGNAFNVAVPGPALTPGIYPLISAASLTGTVNPAPSFTGGNGLASGTNGVVSISGNSVILIVALPSTPFDTWATSKGLTAANKDKNLDPDNDGRNNLAEFAFNGDPLSGSDNGKVFVLTEDSDFDGDATKELILTVAVRTGTAVFSGTPSPTAIQATDGITYSIEGGLDLANFLTPVNVVPTPITTGMPAAGAGYAYRSFRLSGSNGLLGQGFLRAKVTSP